MAERYLVETTRKPAWDYGTNDYHFKDAQIVKLRPDQNVTWGPEIEAREYQAKREGLKEGRLAGLKDGQEEAWALAQKIVGAPSKGGYSFSDLKDIFGTGLVGSCFRDNTYQEAVDKVKKWEETANIQVGEVLVTVGNVKALVTNIEPDHMHLLYSDGSCGRIPKEDIKEFYKKTSQRFDLTTICDLLKEEEE